jgi:glycosyltransferase involved in cell wall biosynthesis
MVPSFIAASDVGILPFHRTVQTDAGLPHKLFQYMLLGKPVAASGCRAIARVVAGARCGLLFEPGNDAAMAEVLVELTDRQVRDTLGENGRRAIVDRYQWTFAAEHLVGLYDRLSRSSGAMSRAER